MKASWSLGSLLLKSWFFGVERFGRPVLQCHMITVIDGIPCIMYLIMSYLQLQPSFTVDEKPAIG